MKRLDQRAYDTPPAPSEQRAIPAPLRYPLLLVPAALGASSIATLLLYFYGVAELGHSVRVLLVPSTAALVVLIVWARRTDRRELYDRIMGGLWAGLFASLAYDIARIPIAHAGIPVFRAISYFGTVFLDQPNPPSPPKYLGKHLYTTWDSLEPDRLAVMWVFQRFVDPDARFYFVRPFSPTPDRRMFGTAFDTPEAEIRRTGTQSAAEKLIVDRGLDKDPRLALMARLGHVWEITPWAYATDTAVKDLSLRMFAAKGTCGDLAEVPTCAERVLRTLDAWYDEAGARRRARADEDQGGDLLG